MTDCSHAQSKPIACKKKVLNHTFKYTSEKCLACGALAWSEKTNREYFKWLNELKRDHKDAFTFQKITLPKPVWDYINGPLQDEIGDNLAEEVNLTSVLKACSMVYINTVARNPRLSANIEAYYLQQDREFVPKDGIANFKFRFSPKFFMTVSHWAERLGMSEGEFVRNAVARVIYAILHEEEAVKNDLTHHLEIMAA